MTGQKLPLPSRLMALQYKLFDRIRHRRASEVARGPGTEADFQAFQSARQCLVITFKRNGDPVPTPVNFGLSDDGRLYFRCEPHVAKIRRLHRNPHVRICPCSLRGKPLGPVTEGAARIVSDRESERAHALIAANWQPSSKLVERIYDRIGVATVYVEVTAGPPRPESEAGLPPRQGASNA